METVFKVVRVEDDGSYKSIWAGCEQIVVDGDTYEYHKNPATYTIGCLTEDKLGEEGLFCFTSLEAAKEAYYGGVPYRRSSKPLAILECYPIGTVRENMDSKKGECRCHGVVPFKEVFTEVKPTEVWEDITDQITFDISGYHDCILIVDQRPARRAVPFHVMADGIIETREWWYGKEYAIALEDKGYYSDGFSILRKV